MISIQKKFLFIHVPKTGGNSIQSILKNFSEDEIITINNHQDGVERFELKHRNYNTTKHFTLYKYKKLLDQNLYNQLFKFATIRNPWDRMISWYFSPHRGFTDWKREEFIKLINSVQPLRYFVDSSFLIKISGKSISLTSNKKKLDQDVDFIMKFECLNEDFKKVCETIKIPYTPLPIRNKSHRKHYSYYYDEELKNTVQKKFYEEINFGGYEFEP